MTLMLHAGAEVVDYAALRALQTPDATASHVPIPHHSVVDMVKYSLGFFGHELVNEDYGVTPDGNRFFGVLTLRSPYGDYTDMVGLRNSHDKRFPIGIAIGSRVFTCDNLAFVGEHLIKRKHTANAKRDLPGLVAEVIEPLGEERKRQYDTFERYKATAITDATSDHAILEMNRRGVINLTRIEDVLNAYEKPDFDWGDQRTAWRLFNATTFALTGKVAENPKATRELHDIIDGVCERLN